ncbi:hypothetical protein BDZ97DRAFT_1733030, partial [Flammula alnicola]
MSMFNNSRNVMIEGSSFTNIQGDQYNTHYHSHPRREDPRKLALDRLLKYIAPGAFHNSHERYDAPKCHPNTRNVILKEVMHWVQDPNNRRLFLWLYGPAGSGKSAIAQTIAELCKEAGILVASFFFSRTAHGRNNPTCLIPTLVYQLVSIVPNIAEDVTHAIDANPAIFSLGLVDQIEALIVRPLNVAVSRVENSGEVTRPPILIILDGVDECAGDKSRTSILDALFRSIHGFQIPIYFLIASRPEIEIRDLFNTGSVRSQIKGLALDDHYEPDHDIGIFFNDKFEEIKCRHPLNKFLSADWPTRKDMRRLVKKASGQFICASTIMKFIESPRHHPMDRLNLILGMSPPGNHTPFAELDALYTQILS